MTAVKRATARATTTEADPYGVTTKKQTTATANTGVLRFAQDDGGETSNSKSNNNNRSKSNNNRSRSLRVTTKEQITATANTGVLRFAQDDGGETSNAN